MDEPNIHKLLQFDYRLNQDVAHGCGKQTPCHPEMRSTIATGQGQTKTRHLCVILTGTVHKGRCKAACARRTRGCYKGYISGTSKTKIGERMWHRENYKAQYWINTLQERISRSLQVPASQ